MKPLKVGVLGVGDISDVYLRNLAKYPIVELAAVAGRYLLLRTRDDYRWGDLPRGDAALRPWRRAPIERPFTETSHRQNSRGIGLIDMAVSIVEGRKPRASVDMELHVLEIMHGIPESAANNVIYPLETSVARPQPMPLQFHDSLSLELPEPARG
ncbi:hypothetical protein [Burkholderia sp. ABCPW 11]|uniref:hypothetical protein n=1 Tax=Burkholderia sp. ABCPW 11 TaxID=1637859 RepID=UPI000A44C18B|nr:hypothetical protein [Burkholderia sp. ABCPW 11]